MNRLCVVMTGTIEPNQATATLRKDSRARLDEYLASIAATAEALKGHAGIKLVFAENSGAATEKVSECCDANSVQLVVDRKSYDASARGKGAGEIALLKAVVDQDDLGSYDHFLKLTGRLQVTNIKRITGEAQRFDYDLICPLSLHGDYSHSRVFAFSRKGFAAIISQEHRIDDGGGVYIEHILANLVRDSRNTGLRWMYPRARPRVRGASGTTGQRYDRNAPRFLALLILDQLLRYRYRTYALDRRLAGSRLFRS